MARPHPCKFCKKLPNISNLSGLYYVYCPGCKNYDSYNFLGRTPQLAYDQWNKENNVNEHRDYHYVRSKKHLTREKKYAIFNTTKDKK